MLQVLARNLDLIEFLEPELAQMRTVELQTLMLWPSIQLFFKLVSPAPQFMDVFVHCRPLSNKLLFKRAANVVWQYGLGEFSDISLCSWRQLEVLCVSGWHTANILVLVSRLALREEL